MGTSVWWAGCGSIFCWVALPLFFFCMIAMAGMMFRRRWWMGMRHGIGSSPDRARETPRQILDRRFASGELTREEYQTRLRDLERVTP
jgi:putative membrane protein